MTWFEGFSKLEWRVLNLSLVFMMVCAFILSNDRVLAKLDGSWLRERRNPMGQILDSKGDVRVKMEMEKEWHKPSLTLFLGDVLYVGDGSRVHIQLKRGVELRTASKGILRFVQLEGVPSVDMVAGDFDWLIDGEQPVAVKGVRGMLSGQQGTVEIRADPDELDPRVKITSGQAQLQINKVQTGPDETRAPEALATPNSVYFYVWRMDDFYQVEEQRVSARDKPPAEVPLEITLNWEHPIATGPFAIQTAGSLDFTIQRRFFSSGELSLTLDKVLLGDNFWRVSFNDKIWSQARSFKVEPRFIEVHLQPLRMEYQIRLRSATQALVKWTVSEAMAGFVAEVSTTPQFDAANTVTRWLSAPELVVEVMQPGFRYARLRALNSRQEISDWSATVLVRAD